MENLTDDMKKNVFAYLLKYELEHHQEIDMKWTFFGERNTNDKIELRKII